jgi:hypothetical protein
MINEPVDWEASKNNLMTRPYNLLTGAVEDDFGIRYHFNQIQSLDKSNPVTIYVINYTNEDKEPDKIYVPTDIYGAFQYILNKEKNIPSSRAVKIQAGLTIQIEKHSKTPMKNYVLNENVPGDYVTYEIRHDYQDQSKMLPYLYVFPTKEEETHKYIDYLNGYISQILEHIYGSSSAKFICICGISFYVYRLSKTGTKICWYGEVYKESEHICLFIWRTYVYLRMYLYSGNTKK